MQGLRMGISCSFDHKHALTTAPTEQEQKQSSHFTPTAELADIGA